MRTCFLSLLLVACSPEDTKPDSSGPSGDNGAGENGGGENGGGDNGGDNGAGDTGGTPGDSDPVAPSYEVILAALRADLGGALLDYSRSDGWPVATAEGYLFVCLDLPMVAGDFDDWGGTALNQEDHFAWAVLSANEGDAYKCTDGGDRWEADPWSRAYNYDSFGEISLIAGSEPHLERHFQVSDGALNPRTVRVWVPTTITHVLYAHDGQNLFDPEAIWGGWHLQDSAPEGMLIVGIDNTDARMDEYTHVRDEVYGDWYGGLGDQYAAFIQEDVRGLIRDTYGEPGPVGTMGSSLGGLISFHIAYQYPGEYDFAASLSGTMGWGSIGANNETMIERYAAAGHQGTALYIDSGGYGTCFDADGDGIMDDDPESADNYCENIQLRDALVDVGYTYEVDLWHWHEYGAEHNEMAWAERVWRPLALFAAL